VLLRIKENISLDKCSIIKTNDYNDDDDADDDASSSWLRTSVLHNRFHWCLLGNVSEVKCEAYESSLYLVRILITPERNPVLSLEHELLCVYIRF